MKEINRWDVRSETLEEEREFRKLIHLHNLTDALIQAIENKKTASHQIERMPTISLSPNLWLYEKSRIDQLSMKLSELIGSQSVRDFLDELSLTLWTIQISTIENAFGHASDKVSLKNILETAAWTHGKTIAETQWKDIKLKSLRDAYAAFLESNFFGAKAFLLVRSTQDELSFISRSSPLQSLSAKEPHSIQVLMDLYQEWMSGFFYGLSRDIKLKKDDKTDQPNFTLLWSYSSVGK